MIFKATTLIVSLLLIGLPLSVAIAAFAERKYLKSQSGTQYAEMKAFGIWIISLITIFSISLLFINIIANYMT
ncbi:hypothetical protein KQ944_07395 [Bacillus subtilis]|uniref:hypothetical protein n=1 Tax=Pseudochrobactrum asaccharolyticum TaxID=354351 RepID=UPI001F23AB5F|nr:hypothetical protein [Pseudochrobactrum asaccharolyticum]MCF7645119.1 hypothetical protein [Pseudochrobactrum asaccharolyticum]MCF7671450.1 hypothetical protein [Bacillus subtilis]